MADNSQTIGPWTNQSAAVTVTGSADAPACVIENNTNVILYARNDGVTAVAQANGTEAIDPGATAILDNELSLQNANVSGSAAKYQNGVTGAFDQSEAVNWTAQTGLVTDSLSIIPGNTTNSGTVTITFQ
jgi:membrane-bound inhibitor of C-type lysozyme